MGRSLFFENECEIREIDEGEDDVEGFKPPDPKWHKIKVHFIEAFTTTT